MPSVAVNWVAVVVATVVAMALGFLWYSNTLFGKAWTKAMGWSAKDMEKMKKDMDMTKTYGMTAVAALVMAYVLAYFLGLLKVTDAALGAQVGFWVWLGFVATTSLTNVVFEGKNWTSYWIGMGYQLVSLAAMGAIIASWK